MARIDGVLRHSGAWRGAVLGALILTGGLSVRVVVAQQIASGAEGSQTAGVLYAASAAPAIVASPPPLPGRNRSRDRGRVLPFSRIALTADAGTLGFGAEVATPITHRLNLHGGFDVANFGYGFTQDGMNHAGTLQLRTGSLRLDVFPFRGGFHVSPGLLFFKSSVGGSLSVPGGNSFSMGDATLTSNAANPVTGNESLTFARSVMPSLTFGFRNVFARESRHWSVPLELGAAYTGHYSAQINLLGSACFLGHCASTSNAMVQASVMQQQSSLNETMKRYQAFPIVMSGVSYRF